MFNIQGFQNLAGFSLIRGQKVAQQFMTVFGQNGFRGEIVRLQSPAFYDAPLISSRLPALSCVHAMT
jgi:hypothetical protein